MKRSLIWSLVVLVAACAKKYDAQYDTSVARPAYTSQRPRVLIDQGHHNHHHVDGTYKPFVELLASDGYDMQTLDSEVTAQALSHADVLVIPTAAGSDDANMTPAFSDREVDAVVAWVSGGGSLLLITDHFPFGDAVRPLAARFGVEMSGGMTFDPVHHDRSSGDDSRLLFTREKGLLASHPITERVGRVMTFTGQSLRGSQGTALLRLSDSAINRAAQPRVERSGGDTKVHVEFVTPTSAAGWAQAWALEHGRGRVVILAEAAMVTAYRVDGKPIGMNVPGVDNRQFLLNAMHWLSRLPQL